MATNVFHWYFGNVKNLLLGVIDANTPALCLSGNAEMCDSAIFLIGRISISYSRWLSQRQIKLKKRNKQNKKVNIQM